MRSAVRVSWKESSGCWCKSLRNATSRARSSLSSLVVDLPASCSRAVLLVWALEGSHFLQQRKSAFEIVELAQIDVGGLDLG